jgi:hypothetical protein
MALHITERTAVHDLAVQAAARMYEGDGFETLVRHQPLPALDGQAPFDLFLPALGRVQEVETGETLPGVDVPRLRRCRESGLQVWVLVPTDALSVAHATLKEAADHIVPFWVLEGERVRFGQPRRP